MKVFFTVTIEADKKELLDKLKRKGFPAAEAFEPGSVLQLEDFDDEFETSSEFERVEE